MVRYILAEAHESNRQGLLFPLISFYNVRLAMKTVLARRWSGRVVMVALKPAFIGLFMVARAFFAVLFVILSPTLHVA